MDFHQILPQDLTEKFIKCFQLFAQGDLESANTQYIQIESELRNLISTKNLNIFDLKLPPWLVPWRKAILFKDPSHLIALPIPPALSIPSLNLSITGSASEVLQSVISLYNDDRLTEAFILLSKLRDREKELFNEYPGIMELESNHNEISNLLSMIKDNEGWYTECSGDIEVKYKSVPGTKTYSLLTTGEIDIPLKHFITLVYETDLFPNWIPFCKKSYNVARLSRSRKVLVQEYSVRFTPKRHTCLYGFGANLLNSEGCVVIYARSCDEKPYFKGVTLPQFSTTRAQVNALGCILTPLSLNRIRFQLLTNFDPNMYYVPYGILNFFTRKLSKGLFKKIAKLAENFSGSVYEERMSCEENREFYDFIQASEAEYLAGFTDIIR